MFQSFVMSYDARKFGCEPLKCNKKFTRKSNNAYEITLSVIGRKSGRDTSKLVWFVHERNTLYLLPNYGSDADWYKNFLANQTLRISVNGEEILLSILVSLNDDEPTLLSFLLTGARLHLLFELHQYPFE